MVFVVSAVRAGFVWLTAVATLIASVPHCDCLCPNGQRKPFCLGVSTARSGCCCGGSCCSSSPGGDGCCQAHGPAPAAPEGEHASCCTSKQPKTGLPGPAAQAGGGCCQKTLANGESATPAPSPEAGQQTLKDALGVPVLGAVVQGPRVQVEGGCAFPWDSHQLPPPTDLVVSLQRFVI